MIKQKVTSVFKGMSLIEILVVVSVFAVLGVITTNSIALTLRGARKSEAQQRVKENLNYTLSVMERHIRGAQNISVCPNPNPLNLDYLSSDNIITSFNCNSVGTNGYVSSGSAKLTADDISIISCSITCTQTDPNNPPIVSIYLEGKDKNSTGVETSKISVQTDITLRNY